MDEAETPCAECGRAVDEFTAIPERWGFWAAGMGELLPYCSECAKRVRARYGRQRLQRPSGFFRPGRGYDPPTGVAMDCPAELS
jgi:hypothetical protein